MQRLQQAEELIGRYVKKQDSLRKLNAFISGPRPSVRESLKTHDETETLKGAAVAVKDNICTSDLPTTCGSRALAAHVSPYEATVVSRLRQAGAVVVGKTNLDEFGMGSHSTHSSFGPVRTPKGHSAGGSSGGSAVAVATGQCDSAIGTDTGGSVRLPAAYNGVYGFKPSYGLISRWGVVAYANSLDTVGFFAQDVNAVRSLYRACNIHDPKDSTNLSQASRDRITSLVSDFATKSNKLRIGVPDEYNSLSLDPGIRRAWSHTCQRLVAAGHSIQRVSLPNTSQALSAYYVLAPAEASSNLAKYDGVRYGTHPPQAMTAEAGEELNDSTLYARVRQYGLGPEVRRRILLGAYSLSAAAIDNYFIQAQRVRRKVQQDFDAVFAAANPLHNFRGVSTGDQSANGSGVDAIVCPTTPTLSPMLEDLEKQDPLDAYRADVLTVPASLAGLPAISVPVARARKGEEQQQQHAGVSTVGMQIIGQFGSDELVLNLAEMMEKEGICGSELVDDL